MTGLSLAPAQIIVLTHEFAPFCGGAATYAEEIAIALHQLDAAVEVWAPDYGNLGIKDDLPFRVKRLSAGGSLQFNHQLQFLRALCSRHAPLETATVILASSGAHLAWLLLASMGRVRNGRVVSVLHGSEILRFERNPFWRFLAKKFYRQLQRVVTVSEFSKGLVQKSFLGSMLKEIIIAPCAAGSAAARTVSPPAGDGRIRILTLARLHPRKGQFDTARALAGLPSEFRNKVIYQVGGAGDTTYLQQVENVCRSAQVAFEYLGPVSRDDLAMTYAHCDIYALTSRTLPCSVEGFGIAYLEAGFHGKPVVGHRTGGVAEAIVDGETGLLVTEGDTAALTDAFARLISDEPLRARMGAAGKIWSARFKWSATARIFADLKF